VQDTEVSRLDPENSPLALALAGVVNVQAVIRPAIRRTPVSVRGVRARAPRSRRLFDLPPFRISDSSWQPCDRSRPGPECLPLLILQDLNRVSRGTTQGPMTTSLSAQLETVPVDYPICDQRFPTACTGGTDDQTGVKQATGGTARCGATEQLMEHQTPSIRGGSSPA